MSLPQHYRSHDSSRSRYDAKLRCRTLAVVVISMMITQTLRIQNGSIATLLSAERSWTAVDLQGSRIRGVLSGDSARTLAFHSSDRDTRSNSTPLTHFQYFEQPHQPRHLSNIGVRQIELWNGDRLHGLVKPPDLSPGNVRSTPPPLYFPFGSDQQIDWRNISTLQPPIHSMILTEFDFETDAADWIPNTPFKSSARDATHAHSGRFGFQCNPEISSHTLQLKRTAEAGWLQCWFYVDDCKCEIGDSRLRLNFGPDSSQRTPTRPDFDQDIQSRIRKRKVTHSTDIVLNDTNQFFSVEYSGKERGSRCPLARQAGWHFLIVKFSAQDSQITIDGRLLGSQTFSVAREAALQSVQLLTSNQVPPFWIDDFTIAESIAVRPRFDGEGVVRLQNDAIFLRSGDQLFGTAIDVNLHDVSLESSGEKFRFSWSEIAQISSAERALRPCAVSGLISQVEFQPLWQAPDWHQSDRLRGAIICIDAQQLVMEHSLLGRITLPLSQIRKITPEFAGTEIQLVGRTLHLGDEIKSNFHRRIAQGTEFRQTFHLPDVTDKKIRIRMQSTEMEPASEGSRPSPLLQRLRDGELISKLLLDGQRIAILNEHVTGHGIAPFPQSIVLDLNPKLNATHQASGMPTIHRGPITQRNSSETAFKQISVLPLKPGDHTLEIRLMPSKDDVPEYDDWELLSLSVEIE